MSSENRRDLISENPHLIVRAYNSGDRAAVHRIAADTAFFGEPVERFLEDRHLFCDLFYAYYTDVEPEHGWVACVGEEVVGFLMGCVDTAAQRRRWLRKILPAVARRAVKGRYRWGELTKRYIIGWVGAWIRGEMPHVNLALYPSHLHMNIDEPWRRRGLGRHLLEAYLEQMRLLGVRGVHLHTTDLNEAACQLYLRVGFQLLDARRTRLWSHLISQPVENRAYGLLLG